MLRKTERFFTKRVNEKYRGCTYYQYDLQYMKRTTYWILWIIPIFTKDKFIKGAYERR